MAKDLIVPQKKYPIYNSGVVVFRKNTPIIDRWATSCQILHDRFGGDQEILSYLISEENISIGELEARWNWSRCSVPNPNALVNHFHGDNGRMIIRHQMEKKCLME